MRHWNHQPTFRNNDLEQKNRARQTAEALFTSKPTKTGASASDSTTTALASRKPRMLPIIPPPATEHHEKIALPIAPEPQTAGQIPSSHRPRIRTLAKYGMTVSQIAEVYGTTVREVARLMRKR